MKLVIDMPWGSNLSENDMRFGQPSPKARGKWRKARVRKPEVQAWMDRLGWEVRAAMMKQSGGAIFLPVGVVVDMRFPDKRRRDSHNHFKVICDSVAAGLHIDDKDIRISTGTVDVDRDNPGFTITVSDDV